MTLVPNHRPGIEASACAGHLASLVHSLGQRHSSHNDLGGNYAFPTPMQVLSDEHGEAKAPVADVLDAPQPGYKDVWHGKQFQQILLFGHCGLHCALRAERPLSAPSAPGAIGGFVRSRTLGKRPLKHGYGKLTGCIAALSQASVEGAI